MSSGPTNKWPATVVVGVYIHAERDEKINSDKQMVGIVLAAKLSNLPDILEPVIQPSHRQFYHSIAIAILLVIAGCKVYKCNPDSPIDEAIRFALMVGIGAYGVHFLLDAGTPKPLLVIGAF